jgi:spore maturation protein A
MLNIIWPLFIILSVIYAILSGNIETLNEEIFNSVGEAVQLTIKLIGIMSVWCGIMKIAQESELIKKFSRLIEPLIKNLFPEIKNNEKAKEEISANISANILGLGNASTPLGLKAMETLQKENNEKNKLSNSMAMLIVLNTASLQIIPTTIIAIRISLNSNNPTAIIIQVWITTICAVIAGIVSTKLFIKLGL